MHVERLHVGSGGGGGAAFFSWLKDALINQNCAGLVYHSLTHALVGIISLTLPLKGLNTTGIYVT